MFNLAGLVLLFPLAACIAAVFLFKGSPARAAAVSIFSMLLSLVSSILLFAAVLRAPGNYEYSIGWVKVFSDLPLELGVLLNPLSSVMLLVVCAVSLCVQVYSLGYMAGDKGLRRYYAYISLFSFSMLGLVLANNLLQMYIFWELVGLCSYLLIGFWYHKPEAANAAKKAFIVTRFGDLGFLVGIILLSFTAGTFNFLQLEQHVAHGALAPHLITLVALLIFAGAAGKSAQFPLHIWLPDAMEGPTPVSALIHAATMVAAGVYLVCRSYFLFSSSPDALLVIAVIGAVTAFMAGSVALVQDDIKRVLAYSTISQLGYMMLGLGVGGYTAGFFHLVTHASFKALLFLCAGSVIHAMHTNNIWEMGGLFKNMKVTAVTFLVGALALAGIFPTSGFFSKDAILIETWAGGHYALFALAFITAGFTAFYMARVFFVVFFSREKFSAHHPHESPAVMYVPLLLLAAPALGLGFWGEGFRQFLLPGPVEAEHAAAIPLVSNLVAALGIFIAWAVYQKELVPAKALAERFAPLHALLRNKYYIDELYLYCVRNILFTVSNAAGWFDRAVVDGAVGAAFSATRSAAVSLRKLQTGLVQTYALGLFGGAAALWLILMLLR
ncbi:MAG: NADH-quinone oxidoreductase subunit L [Endomicrobiales bacterium]